jgi:hypothetical protein
MMTFMKTIVFAILVWIISLNMARAELLDIRDYWHMTCFPSYSMPYDVEIIKGQTLVISSHRYYHIVSATRSTPGFVVKAIDENIGRAITAGFGPARGYVETITGIETCSGDM